MASKSPDRTIWVNVETAYRSLDRLCTEALDDVKLNAAQAHILWALYQEDHQRPSDLARAVGRPPTSFTPILDSVERAGLVGRKPNPADRRSVTVQLTKQGKQLQGQIEACFRKVEAEVHQRLSAKELESLNKLLQKLEQRPTAQGHA